MADDFSTYEGRQAYRDAHPGAIVDASGAYYPSTGQTVTGGSAPSGATPTVNAASGQLASGINSLLGAIASGNKEAFNEAVRQFNVTFGLDQQKFAEATRQFNENFGISQAGVTGTYQGAPTLQAQLQAANIAAQRAQTAQNWANIYGYTPQFDVNGNPVTVPGQTLQAQQQAYAQQMGAIQAAAAAQTNPFRQAEITGQLGRLLQGSGVAGFQAPGGTSQTDFSGMGNLQRMIDDIRGGPGAINSQTVQQSLNMIPTPNKVNSQDFFRSDPNTQNLLLSGMQQKYGLDPSTSLQQIRNTLPSFTAPSTFGSVRG